MFMLTRYPTLVGVALLFPICVSTYSDVSSESIKELPFCGPEKSLTQRRLVFVSTLDGKLSALNIDNGGLEQWSINTGPGPMLSSSIHTLELTNNGQWVRMIPSLSGGLYKFDGENVEPIPVNAEKLLQSSFRYSEDTIISGGKESRTYGVDSVTGNVLYECSMDRCLNLTESGPTAGGDVVVIQRQTQTVRAVEPRSGVERWNFSVGTHGVRLAADPDADCHSPPAASSDILLRAIVPDGLLCAVSKSRPSLILWSRKFDFPIVSAWQLDRGDIKWVDLFGGDAPSMDVPKAPLLYIGMHKKQLYIQESVVMQRKMIEYSVPQLPARPNTIIPWKPVPARALEIPGNSDGIQLITDEGTTTTALSILYGSEYVNEMFANNALEQGTGQEVELACNQVVSVAFEKVLPLVDHEHQKTFEDSFLKNLRLACVDRFCSHVTQLLVQLSARAVIDGKQDIGDSFVLKCIKFNINNIEEFSSNVYACHVVRTCLDTIKELNECIPSDLAQQAYNALIASSLFVGVTLSNSCEEMFDTMLLEVAIECSNQKYFTKLYAKIFVNRFAYLAVHEVGNFSLQKLIRCCSDLSEFEGIFSEASRCIESALQCGHGGIIAVLAETCKRLGTHQGDFINSLMKALKCFEPSEKQNEVCLRTAMMSDDKINPDRPINLHGSLTLQAMFHFRKPIKVIRSLISVPPSTLVRMFCDPRGSRIADAFFTGPFVGEKNKEKFLMHLKAHLVNIASDKHGSRAIDTAWNSVGEKAQLLIIETLSKEGAKLESSPWGRKVSKNIDLALFRANRSSWVAAVARIRQSRRLIDPLITSRSQS